MRLGAAPFGGASLRQPDHRLARDALDAFDPRDRYGKSLGARDYAATPLVHRFEKLNVFSAARPAEGGRLIPRRTQTAWGDPSLIEATRNLLWEAYRDPLNQRWVAGAGWGSKVQLKQCC